MSVLWDLGGSQDMVHQWYSTEDLDNLDQVYLLSSGRTNIPSLSNLKLRSLTYNNCDIFKNSQRFSWSWCRSHPTVTYAVAPPDGFTCLLCSCVCPWTAAPADVPLGFTGQRSGLVHRLVSSAVLWHKLQIEDVRRRHTLLFLTRCESREQTSSRLSADWT